MKDTTAEPKKPATHWTRYRIAFPTRRRISCGRWSLPRQRDTGSGAI